MPPDQLEPYTALHFPGYTATLGQMKSGIEQAIGRPLKNQHAALVGVCASPLRSAR
jgi:hypothetical protein